MGILNSSLPRALWIPPDIASTNLDLFRRKVNAKRRLNIKTYKELHAWSTSLNTASDFWIDLFEYLDLKPGVVPKSAFKATNVTLYPPPQFFPGITFNFAEHVLNGRPPDQIALYCCREGAQEIQTVSWNELHSRVGRMANAMRRHGLQKGDRVAAVISNCAEAIVACLAVLSIGAIFSTSSPDLGTNGILDRITQIEPRFVIFESDVLYNGKVRPLMNKVRDCVSAMRVVPKFQTAILLVRGCQSIGQQLPPNVVTWEQFNEQSTEDNLVFEQVPFHHPGFIVYSSGTTGPPKCIVHSAAGLLMKVKIDYMMNLDVYPGDTVYQYTTTGWIMWQLLLCGLSYGAKVVLYDGSPLLPDPLVTLRLVEKLKYGLPYRLPMPNHTGVLNEKQNYPVWDVSQIFIRSHDCRRELIDLSSLRTVSSTGSVLNADVCEWFYDHGFPQHVHLVSASGGTDLAGSLVSGDPTSPVYAGEIQGPALGMAIDVLSADSSNPSSIAMTGTAGELVCRMPFPSQPVKFWGKGGNSRYRDAYYERFGPNVWYQGDFVSKSVTTGGYVMLGRSDGVLNPSGVRFGSAEIYNAIMYMDELEETICVGQRRPQDLDEVVLLFVKTKGDIPLTPELVSRTKAKITAALTPRHVPKLIFQVPEIPYTVNGKKIELAVKQIVSGQKVTPSSAVANPESLKYYERFYHWENLLQQEQDHTAKPHL